jgi:hypothetical protein
MSRFATTAQKWPRAPDVQTFAVYAVMRVGPGAARSLFVAGTILVAVHVALLAFDPHALLLSNLLILMFDLLGLTVCLLGASSESPETRPLWLLFGCGLLLVVVGSLDGRITTSRFRYTLRLRPTTPTAFFCVRNS